MRIIENSDRKRTYYFVAGEHHPVGVKLKLHVDSDHEHAEEDVFRFDQPPGQTIRTTVESLAKSSKRTRSTRSRFAGPNLSMGKAGSGNRSVIAKTQHELEQHLTQVACQQAQLMKLQQNLVDSQQAIRAIVERLVERIRGRRYSERNLRLFEMK